MSHLRDEIYLRIEARRLEQEKAGNVQTTLLGELRTILKVVLELLSQVAP